MRQAEDIISKIFLNLLKAVGTVFLGFTILVFLYSYFWKPSKKKAINLVVSRFHYAPPISAKLIYSKNYWAKFDNIEPRSICLEFQYSKQNFSDFNNFDFSKNNHDDAYHSSYPVINNKGCAKLIAGKKQIKKHFRYSEYSQGGTIFVDVENKTVIFEIYFFD